MSFFDFLKHKPVPTFTLDLDELVQNIEQATKELQKVLYEVYGEQIVQGFEEAASKGRIKGTTSPKSEALAHYGNYHEMAKQVITKIRAIPVTLIANEQEWTEHLGPISEDLNTALRDLELLSATTTANKAQYDAQKGVAQRAIVSAIGRIAQAKSERCTLKIKASDAPAPESSTPSAVSN